MTGREPPDSRVFLVLLPEEGAITATLAQGLGDWLGTSAYEARQLLLRRVPQPLTLCASAAEAETGRAELAAAGLSVLPVPQTQIQQAPDPTVVRGLDIGGAEWRFWGPSQDRGITVPAPALGLLVLGRVLLPSNRTRPFRRSFRGRSQQRRQAGRLGEEDWKAPVAARLVHCYFTDRPAALAFQVDRFDYRGLGGAPDWDCASNFQRLRGEWARAGPATEVTADRFPAFRPVPALLQATIPEGESPPSEDLLRFRAYSLFRAAAWRARRREPVRTPERGE